MSLKSLARSAVSAVFGEVRGNPLENPAFSLSAFPQWMTDLFTGGPNAAGVAVNETTAMQLATVYACINVLASDISSLPLKVYERKDTGRHPAINSALWKLLIVEPNPEMTPATFLGTWLGCAALTGNGYAQIQWDGSEPVALWPRHPRTVTPRRKQDGTLFYDVNINGAVKQVPVEDMLHLPGVSLDGWVGLNPIQAARQTIGTAIAVESFGAGFFGRGSRPSGLLTGPEVKAGKTENIDAARESWEKANSGGNQGRTAVLPNGWSWTAIGVAPEDAQFLETQQYTRSQIAAIFRIPPHMVGDTSRLSNSNHESQALEYVNFTLRPWLVRIEAEVQRKLVHTVGRSAGKYTVRFDVSELIRGDFASQMTGFATGRQWGYFNADDVREMLGLNPLGGAKGKEYLVPLNMVAAGSAATGSEPDNSTDPAGDGGDDPADANEATPKGNGGRNQLRNRQEGILVERMAAAYAPLVTDACQRLSRRQKRDNEAVAQIFGPVCDVIAAEARRQAAEMFDITGDPDLGEERTLRDYRKAVEKRAAGWQPEKLDGETLQAEAGRAVRAIVLPILREAVVHIAVGGKQAE